MDDHEYWLTYARVKGRRARRRETEAVLEPGHLRKWFTKQYWFWFQQPDLFKQIVRAFGRYRDWNAYEARQERHRERHQVKIELRKGDLE